MVIEAWNSNNCKKIGVTDDNGWNPKRSRPCGDGLQDVGVRSGKVTIEQIIGEKSGKTEIKIWPVFGGNMKSVFIYVEMD